ncbi:hypothetical protein ACL03H_10365 [Saccharopolyspora sp. MS10]
MRPFPGGVVALVTIRRGNATDPPHVSPTATGPPPRFARQLSNKEYR